jgi:hypothetical protein
MHLLENEYQPLFHADGKSCLLSIERIAFFEFLKYPNFDLTCIAVLWYSSNDLDRDSGICLSV